MTAASCGAVTTAPAAGSSMAFGRRVLLAGALGSLAMIPVGLAIRHLAGGSVNVYGELVVERLVGRVVPWALVVEHFLVGWVFAVPLAAVAPHARAGALVGAGLGYGVAVWVAVNSLALPWAFGRPTPWTLGWAAIWPSLTVHAAYGTVAGWSLARFAARR